MNARNAGKGKHRGDAERTRGPVGDRAPVAERDPDESRRRFEIERASPEGRPAHPEYGARGIAWLLIGAALFVMVLSGAVAATSGLAAGAVVLVFGLGLVLLCNPAVWSASLRAGERWGVEHDDGRGR